MSSATAEYVLSAGVKCTIELIWAAEESFCHTNANAKRYHAAVNHPGMNDIPDSVGWSKRLNISWDGKTYYVKQKYNIRNIRGI